MFSNKKRPKKSQIYDKGIWEEKKMKNMIRIHVLKITIKMLILKFIFTKNLLYDTKASP